jgi:hypothetical protein
MATLISRVSAVVLTFVAVAVLGQLSACSDDIVEIPQELRGDPYCALIIGMRRMHTSFLPI